MTANQAIRAEADFSRYACHIDSLEGDLARMGAQRMARVNLDQASELLGKGERETAIYYLNRAEWALWA